jgi:hypothetical protein
MGRKITKTNTNKKPNQKDSSSNVLSNHNSRAGRHNSNRRSSHNGRKGPRHNNVRNNPVRIDQFSSNSVLSNHNSRRGRDNSSNEASNSHNERTGPRNNALNRHNGRLVLFSGNRREATWTGNAPRNRYAAGNSSADGYKAAVGRATAHGSRIEPSGGRRSIALGTSAAVMGATTFLKIVSPFISAASTGSAFGVAPS